MNAPVPVETMQPATGRVPNRVPGDFRVVPPAGRTAGLTVLTAAAMAFLATFVLALSMASGRLADRWDAGLARSATLRIAVPDDQRDAQVARALAVLEATPGISAARALDEGEEQALLQPWLGTDLPLDMLPVPQLIDISVAPEGFDADGLRLRLAAEVPGAVLDDHTRWRAPLVAAAERLRAFGLLALVLIGVATAAMISLAAQASLAANAQVIAVLRQVGALDSYIARAFVRRFTLRALGGAAAGTVPGMLAVAILAHTSGDSGFLGGLGFQGAGWLWPLAVPPLAAIVAFAATRAAALRNLRGLR